MKRALLIASLYAAAPLSAQSAGKTGAQVLQFNAGARASALSGAYSSARDADALFYNPAGIGGARVGASAAYESYSTKVSFGSAAGFTRMGAFAIGAGIAYLDAGEIAEVIPDQDFGGNTGTPTGNSVRAIESAARLSIALPLQDGRLRLGASLGFVSVGIAEVTSNAPVADFGVQYDWNAVTLSAVARNVGGTLSGDGDTPLPTELRIGAALPITAARGIGVSFFADAISRVREGAFTIAAGIEGGLIPKDPDAIGLVARVGYDAEANQLSALRFGAGVTIRSVALDYAFQDLDFVGAVHRFGIRWSVR